MVSSLLVFAQLLVAPAFAQTMPPGQTVDEGVSVQITPEGLQAMGDLVPALLPSNIPIDDQSLMSGAVTISNMWIGVQVDDLRMVPRQNLLDVEVDLTVWINDATDPFDLAISAGFVSGDCLGHVEPFPVWITLPFTLAVVDDGSGTNTTMIDATLGTIGVTHGLTSGDPRIKLSDCAVGTIDALLQQFLGWSIFDPIIDLITPLIEPILDTQRADLEAQLEDALNQLRFEDTLDLMGAQLEIKIQPEEIDISPDGLEIVMSSRMHAAQDACMTEYDPGGSLWTNTARPDIATLPTGAQMAILLADDMANQALYAVWRSGTFCFAITEDNADFDIGLPINSSLLGVLGGEAFEEIIPETKPLSIYTDPVEVPTVDYTSTHDITIVDHDLGLDFYSEVDYREARVLGLTVELDAGVDLIFDQATGSLDVDLAIGMGENIVLVPEMIELTPDSGEEIVENLYGLIEVIIEQMAGDSLTNLSFLLPSMEDAATSSYVGLKTLSASPTGAQSDWLLAEATVGAVTYNNGGCDGNGCDSSGCSGGGGCSSAGPAAFWLFLIVPFVARRRRSA